MPITPPWRVRPRLEPPFNSTQIPQLALVYFDHSLCQFGILVFYPLTIWARTLCAKSHRAGRAMLRCSTSLRGAQRRGNPEHGPVCGVVALAGRGPARGGTRSCRPRVRRPPWSRGIHPCLTRPPQYAWTHPTAESRIMVNGFESSHHRAVGGST